VALIAEAVPRLDLAARSRVAGWTNREVLAHLSIQPALLARFLQSASREPPTVTLASNLPGTAAFDDVIDAAARAADDADLDFGARVDAVVAPLARADLTCTVTTLQGPILLADYLRTRCVEAVVHARYFSDPAPVDPEALEVAAEALTAVVQRDHPALVPAARALPSLIWVEAATGGRPRRRRCDPSSRWCARDPGRCRARAASGAGRSRWGGSRR
jgi:hypothetical protein